MCLSAILDLDTFVQAIETPTSALKLSGQIINEIHLMQMGWTHTTRAHNLDAGYNLFLICHIHHV